MTYMLPELLFFSFWEKVLINYNENFIDEISDRVRESKMKKKIRSVGGNL